MIVPDDKVSLVFVAHENATIECDTTIHYVDPSWIALNGTPCCICGDDMVYSHTEVNIPKPSVTIAVRGGVAEIQEVSGDVDVRIVDYDNGSVVDTDQDTE